MNTKTDMSERFNNYDENIPATLVSTAVSRNDRLSWKARGLFSYICSLNKKSVYANELVNGSSHDGYKSTQSAMEELARCGYLRPASSHDKSIKRYYVPSEYVDE